MLGKISKKDWLTIGQISARTGLATSAIRYYDSQGLIAAHRDNAGQRRFRRADIRRLSFVVAAQTFGLSLSEIKTELRKLPVDKILSADDWEKISVRMRARLDTRIADLERLRDKLDGCIGCGCLSMDQCTLFNPGDAISKKGTGARILLGDSIEDL